MTMPKKRCVVERTHAWLERNRRLVMHHHRKLLYAQAWVWLARARMLLGRFLLPPPRESHQEKGAPSLRPLRSAKGRPPAGRLLGAPQNSLRACGAPFRQLRRASETPLASWAPLAAEGLPRVGSINHSEHILAPATPRGFGAEHPLFS